VSAIALPSRPAVALRLRLRALVRGRAADPGWVRPSLLTLLAATALLYLVGLGASGWANGFYSAAVQAGSSSWKAFFFGSFDSSSFITVDKPPASLWVMDLSARVFGVNAWSILAPQALEGVAAVGLLYLAVRRRFGALAGLVAGATLALTPVATLMFRFDNPDALLTLLLVAAAYALVRALEHASTRWLLLVGALVGTAFLAKMLQAFAVVPGFALVYLVAAPASLRRRLAQLGGAGLALVVGAGWWVAIVTAWPASSRPYIGGSQHNSIVELIFGYNGFGRLTGNESGSVVAGGQGRAGAWGPTGIGRLFGAEMGTQISWLLPAALLALVALLVATRRAPRTDGRRASIGIWGTWLLVTGVVFSFAQGIIHPYYTVALAPAIAALVGAGTALAWEHRDRRLARAAAASALVATGIWSAVLLGRTPSWHPELRVAVVVGSLLAGGAFLLASRGLVAVGLAGVVVALAAPAAYAVQTAATPHAGAIPAAGPAGASRRGGPGGRPFGGPGAFPQGGARAGFGPPPAGFGVAPRAGNLGQARGIGSTQPRPGLGGGGPGGPGGILATTTPSASLVQLLKADAGRFTWVAATVGANSAAGFQLAAQAPVMAIGGFNGTDPAPTLGEFERLVAARAVHYFVAGGAGGGFGRNGQSAIASWVATHFTARTVGGTTVYDLTV
jgi:4-amino-4-deoxy-L-arabinose transferase-like glycosyltransferase